MQTVTDTVLAKRVMGRKTADGYLVATAQLHLLDGNERPYFSVTAELWQSKGWYENGQDGRMISCGQLVDEIRETFPELIPVQDVHLADDAGVPGHAEANGWYFYSDAYTNRPEDGQDTHAMAARALHIEPSELPEGMSREQFHTFVESLRPRWKAQAARALSVLSED